MTSSGSPDVVMTYAYYPVISWAANGFIQPLDEYAAEAGIKEEDFFPIAWDMINFADHTWGLLQEFDFNQFWWNKAIHDGEPPKTIDELDAMAKEYTTFDADGNLTQAGFIPWLHETDPSTAWSGSGPSCGAANGTTSTTGSGRSTSPENQLFLEWFLTYVDLLGGRDKSDAFEAAIPKVYGDIFQSGLVAFAQQGEWMPAYLKAVEIDLDYGIAQTPTAEGVPLGTAITGGGNLFLLPTNAAHPAEAVTFIQYMGTGQSVLNWCIPNSNIPPTMAAAEDPSFQPVAEAQAVFRHAGRRPHGAAGAVPATADLRSESSHHDRRGDLQAEDPGGRAGGPGGQGRRRRQAVPGSPPRLGGRIGPGRRSAMRGSASWRSPAHAIERSSPRRVDSGVMMATGFADNRISRSPGNTLVAAAGGACGEVSSCRGCSSSRPGSSASPGSSSTRSWPRSATASPTTT